MSKIVIFALVAVIAVADVHGLIGDVENIKTNEISSLQKEGRVLLEFPSFSTILFKSLKAVWFLLTTICSIVDFKVAAVSILVNAGLWILSFKFPLIVGAALMLGFCKLTGLCASSHGLYKTDELAYAADYLDLGTLKYGESA